MLPYFVLNVKGFKNIIRNILIDICVDDIKDLIKY